MGHFKSITPKISLSSNVWLISFGDLLTLVLCFFISVISLSPLNPGRNLPVKDGTELADMKKDIQEQMLPETALNLPVYESDLLSSGIQISETALERIKSQVSPVSYKVSEVKLETCWQQSKLNLAESWDKSLGLLDGLRSQVFDAVPGLYSKTILRNSVMDCAANNAARLIIEF